MMMVVVVVLLLMVMAGSSWKRFTSKGSKKTHLPPKSSPRQMSVDCCSTVPCTLHSRVVDVCSSSFVFAWHFFAAGRAKSLNVVTTDTDSSYLPCEERAR